MLNEVKCGHSFVKNKISILDNDCVELQEETIQSNYFKKSFKKSGWFNPSRLAAGWLGSA